MMSESVLQEELTMNTDILSRLNTELTRILDEENDNKCDLEKIQLVEQMHMKQLNIRINQLQNQFDASCQNDVFKTATSDKEIKELEEKLAIIRLYNEEEEFVETFSSTIPEEVLEISIEKNEVLEQTLNDFKQKNRELFESNNQIQVELDGIYQALKTADDDSINVYEALDSVKEDIILARQEERIFLNKNSSNENSLFSELNNRRLKHQNYLMQLNKEYNLTNFEISTIEAQLNITRRQHMEISEFLEKDSIEFKENYETLLMFYKDKKLILEELLMKNEQILLQKQQLITEGLPKDTLLFLKQIPEDQKKYNKSITDTISKEYGTLKQISEDLRKAEFEILNLKITKEKLTQMLSDLKVSDVEKHDNEKNVKYPCSSTMISNTPPVVLENIEKKIDHNELEQKKVTFAPGTDCSEKLNKPVIRRGKSSLKLM